MLDKDTPDSVDLYHRFLTNRLSKEESIQLKAIWEEGNEEILRSWIAEGLEQDERFSGVWKEVPTVHMEYLYEGIQERISRQRRKWWYSSWAASAALLAVLFSTLLYVWPDSTKMDETQSFLATQVLPGSNKAVLTLEDGRSLTLDQENAYQVDGTEGLVVATQGQGLLHYHEKKTHLEETVYHRLETPKGGEYLLQLADGSRIWLNAGSSLRYPVSFEGLKERKVELTGEAYFDIAKNKALPFRVVSGAQTVEVMGTHFNVQAYADEPHIRTTLIEGSVAVHVNNEKKILQPGQESLLGGDGRWTIQEADMETAMAWKNGRIYFRDADIRQIMRQVSRWYNIEVRFEGEIPQRTFNGGLSRNSSLSVLLKILSLNQVSYELKKKDQQIELWIKP